MGALHAGRAANFRGELVHIVFHQRARGIAPAHAQRDLTVVSWGGAYQDGQKEVFFKPFNATGTKLLDEAWDGGLGVLRTKFKGGNNTWDVVQVEADELEVGCDEGLYEKLDVAKIGGAGRYLPGTVHACGVGAIIYNLVLAYDGDKTKAAETQAKAVELANKSEKYKAMAAELEERLKQYKGK